MKHAIQLKLTAFIVWAAAALTCLGLVPNARATDTDGALPFGNNADGVGVLTSLTTGAWNSAFGFEALNQDTIGSLNTATGLRALFSNTEGEANTANGMMALFSNTTGVNNVAIGAQALVFNTDGFNNTAVGTQALSSNTTGTHNTANGYQALFFNTTGNRHTAVGFGALQNCIAPPVFSGNTAIGNQALFSNTTGTFNTAIGDSALFSNTIGTENTAIGNAALQNTTIGIDNAAVGLAALQNNTLGSSNTALGSAALLNNVSGLGNQAVGRGALRFSTGNQNIAIGLEAGSGVTTASNVICIGSNLAGANVSNSCYIGSIFGQTSSGSAAVFINSNGQLGTLTSSLRFKDEIKTMDKASEALFALQPVTFRYKKEIDPQSIPQFGLVAEDVEKVNPDLVVRDKEGKPYSVRYDAVNAMLLNEFLKEHRKNEEQQKQIDVLMAQLKEQAAQIQKVSAQIEVNKTAPQIVLKNQ